MHTLLLSLALVSTQGTPATITPLPSIDQAQMAAAEADLERAQARMGALSGVVAQLQTAELPARRVELAAVQAQLASLDATRGLELARERAQLAALDSRRTLGTVAPLPTPELTAPIVGDPGDSLYRAGTSALNRGDYARAAQLFHQVREKYPTSVRAGDSYYWEAFALYRQSGTDNLKGARTLLAQQQVKFPSSATRGDASSLYGRVQGELARRGDPDAQIWVNTQTSSIAPAVAPAAPTPAPDVAIARPARAPRPAMVSTMERPERPENPERPEARGGDDNDDDLPPGCDRTTYETKVEAMNALIGMQSDRSMPIIRRVLAKRDKCSPGLRKKAVFLLSQHQDDSTGAVLLDVVRNDPDAEVKAQAVFWLSQVNSPQAVAALEDILKNSTDIDLQRKALFSLSQQKDPRSAQILRTYAERSDVPEELQEQAIFWLSQTNDGNNGEFLRGLYGRLTRESAKEKVLFALSQQDDPANGPWLVARAKDANESMELRKRALFWAGQRKGALPDLIGLYAATPDREMREQLVFVYSQSREQAAADKLFDIAKNDPDPELRKKALFWLGQSNDPRVVQLLQDIIDK